MPTISISNWNELHDALFEGSWDSALERFRSPYVFRGLSDSKYSLDTSLMRLKGEYPKVEKHLLRNFKKYAHRSIVERDSIWYWLSVAQHHGLPTRLLDWTYSPYVAMHFATANIDRYTSDGAVWKVNLVAAHEELPSDLKSALNEVGSYKFDVEMLSEIVTDLKKFDSLSAKPFLLFFEPPSMDDRITNQYALFSVISDTTLALDGWLKDRPDLWTKIVIPASLKWEVRDKLDQANITERVLFPGLDGLSSWLKRFYSPKK